MKGRKAAYVLLVGEDTDAAAVQEALAAGIEVRRCPGPGTADCPVAGTRKRCPLRQNARATVVYIDRHDPTFPTLPCLELEAGPTVAVLAGTRLPLSTNDDYALVGSDEGAAGVLKALAAVVDGVATSESGD